MTVIDQKVYTSMGLSEFEYKKILQLMGREPTLTELGMFAVQWSEHCGYKYSRKVLEAFKEYKDAVEGSGLENAGVVPIGSGLGITFKVESHNHPSAVEPYQGAATGVGGIIRDVLTMGARPIALLNSIRFGPLESSEISENTAVRNRYIFENVVAGIAGYGNCVGVPTIGGEVGFHKDYSGNPLVNAMCVGLVTLDEVTTASARNVGEVVLYLGSSTGKDGIHGATFASDDLNEDSEAKRPNVQIGDPFAEKLLIEATLEALQTGAISAIQDMGAAGLTCSTIEMAAKGNTGMEINLDLVPMREPDMTGYELMLSESQERMLATVPASRAHEIIQIFEKWGLPAVAIGHVIQERVVRVRRFDQLVAELDPWWLTNECPSYQSDSIESLASSKARDFCVPNLAGRNIEEDFNKMVSNAENASKGWVYRQYDQQVQTQTQLSPGTSDAAVISPRGTSKAIALTIDCNSRQVKLAPYVGAWNGVHEAARNLACSGAIAVGSTDCLNFGNPQNPEVYWEFKEAVYGLADSCEAVKAPVLSGNVSFYNRSDGAEIPPTPVIGMAGILESADDSMKISPVPSELSSEGYQINLVWSPEAEKAWKEDPLFGLGASSYLAQVLEIENGKPIAANKVGEESIRTFLNSIAKMHVNACAHDVAEGGLLLALFEVAHHAKSGMNIDLTNFIPSLKTLPKLFAEPPGFVLVSVPRKNMEQVVMTAEKYHLNSCKLGEFHGSRLNIRFLEETFSWDMAILSQLFENGISKYFG